jgi:hypothetical protein
MITIHWPSASWLPRILREKTGAKDLHGRDIREGDDVFLYRLEYERIILNPDDVCKGLPPIHDVDSKRPRPVADVPMARGEVRWDSFLMAYVIRFRWNCQQWDTGIAGCLMGGANYVYEIL